MNKGGVFLLHTNDLETKERFLSWANKRKEVYTTPKFIDKIPIQHRLKVIYYIKMFEITINLYQVNESTDGLFHTETDFIMTIEHNFFLNFASLLGFWVKRFSAKRLKGRFTLKKLNSIDMFNMIEVSLCQKK